MNSVCISISQKYDAPTLSQIKNFRDLNFVKMILKDQKILTINSAMSTISTSADFRCTLYEYMLNDKVIRVKTFVFRITFRISVNNKH